VTALDRHWLTSEYLPSLDGRILYIGINDYTNHYHSLVKEGSVFETLDSCPIRSGFGNTSFIHYNVSVQVFDPKYLYDHVSMHGCHGYKGHNINNSNILKDIVKLDSLVGVGGTLQFGPGVNLNLENYTKSFWDDFVNGPPFIKYDILCNKIIGMNYIWWGQKIEE